MWLNLISCALFLFAFNIWVSASNSLVEDGSKDNSEECDCYLTSGTDPGYFQYYRFFDFRNVSSDGNNDYTTAPPLITSLEDQGEESTTCAYLNTTDFQANWSIQDDIEEPNADVPSIYSAQNIYISRNSTPGSESSTYLTLRASRLPKFMSGAQIESNQRNLFHSSIRARLRFIPNGMSNASAPTDNTEQVDDNKGSNASHPVDPGAVLGFFTYLSDTQESDIEIISGDPISSIRYSNQPDYDAKTDEPVDGASTDFTMPNGIVWTEWFDHRIDWFDGISSWYINNELMLNKTINVPTKPSGLIFNLWGDGESWSGNMSLGGQVSVAIEWIEMAFNISGDVNGPGSHKRGMNFSKRAHDSICNVGCNVDGVRQIGFPEMAFNSTGSGAFSIVRQGGDYGLVYLAAGFLCTYFLFG